MTAALALLAATIRSIRRTVTWWSIGIAGLVAATVAFWPAFRGASGISAAIDSLPAGVIAAFGLQDFGSPAGFLRGNLYEFFVPLLLTIAAVAFVNGQTAADERSGRLELFLSQPLPHGLVYASRAAGVLLGLVGITVVALAVQGGMNGLIGLSIDGGLIASTVVLCALLAALHASLAYAIACVRPRSSLVLGVGIGGAIAGYVVNALFPLAHELKDWVAISPWQWALGGDPLIHAAEPWRYAALLLPTLGLIVVGTLLVGRRDVAAA
jgi:ABC-2 type transport system permease protein